MGGDLPSIYYRTLDPFVALTAAAATTRNLKLGTGIALVPQRDVIHLANETARLDLVSDGRLVLVEFRAEDPDDERRARWWRLYQSPYPVRGKRRA